MTLVDVITTFEFQVSAKHCTFGQRTLLVSFSRITVSVSGCDLSCCSGLAEGLGLIQLPTSTLANWQRFKANLKEPQQYIYGNVSIYCSVTASYSFLHHILEQLRAQHQHIEITLSTGDPALAINRVLDGHESMAIAAKPNKLPAQIAFVDIGYSPLVFIAPKIACSITQKLASNTPSIDWSELEFIVPEQGFARQRLEQWWPKK